MKIMYPETALVEERNPFKKIELVGRTCYKSDSEFTDETGLKFYNSLKDLRHYGIFEHIRFVFEIDIRDFEFYGECLKRPYFACTAVTTDKGLRYLVSADLRALNEGRVNTNTVFGAVTSFMNLISETFSPELDYATFYDTIEHNHPVKIYRSIFDVENPQVAEIMAHTEVTMHFITDRGISHEFVRHREFSFAQESTRYCNYGLEKFGKEITVINPFVNVPRTPEAYDIWVEACKQAEKAYFDLLDMNVAPQNARSVLPTDLKTELMMTGTLNMWKHFFELRYFELTGKAHPLAKYSATQAWELLLKDDRYAVIENACTFN